ncbi:hypothetical protein EDD17DRAFT_1894158 [Pisolithus thermaeus]|nr:hypothetical protein EDD17DRAFT_1894158 [Pisolithus thermaeus]
MLPLGHARTREDGELLTVKSTVQPSSALKGQRVRPRVASGDSRRHDVSLVSPTQNPQHPLRRRSHSIPIDTETDYSCHATGSETRPRLARLLDHSSQDAEEDGSMASDTSHTGSASGEATTVVHKVSSTDSLPSVALRYGISVAALRRANKLWPSDPIYLRTELKVPRADPTPARCNSTSVEGVELPAPELSPRSSSDSHASTVAATVGDAILSVFPARASLDSLLSSRTSSSEILELDDLAAMRASRSLPGVDHVPSITSDGYELSILGAQPKAPATTALPPLPFAEDLNAACLGYPSLNGDFHYRAAALTAVSAAVPTGLIRTAHAILDDKGNARLPNMDIQYSRESVASDGAPCSSTQKIRPDVPSEYAPLGLTLSTHETRGGAVRKAFPPRRTKVNLLNWRKTYPALSRISIAVSDTEGFEFQKRDWEQVTHLPINLDLVPLCIAGAHCTKWYDVRYVLKLAPAKSFYW